MKIKINVERNGNVCKGIVTLTSSADDEIEYEFTTYKDDAVDILETLMKEKGQVDGNK